VYIIVLKDFAVVFHICWYCTLIRLTPQISFLSWPEEPLLLLITKKQ
jgi:hypothetical protein